MLTSSNGYLTADYGGALAALHTNAIKELHAKLLVALERIETLENKLK